MTTNTHHKVKQLAHQRLLWVLVLSIWFFIVNISIVHAQHHEFSKDFVSDYQCQLCLSTFNHSPCILSTNLYPFPEIQHNYIIKKNATGIIKTHQLIPANRGPPAR